MKVYFLVLALTAGCSSLCGQARLEDSIKIRLQRAIATFKDKYQCPGISVAIVHDSDIVYSLALGYTDLENKTAATIDAKFPIMSITKVFTATMLMQLRERGIVRLEDDVRRYVPEYKVLPSATLLQLATHAAGLPRNSPADINFTTTFDARMLSGGDQPIKGFCTNKDLLHSLQYIKLEYPPYDYLHPNDRHYSNLGYEVLGIALERAAKEEYTSYVLRHICRPLGMTHTGFMNEPGMVAHIAKGYRSHDGQQDIVPFFELNSGIYAGGLYSTAGDLCRFISSQWEGERNAMMRQLKIGWKPAFPYVLHEGAFPGFRSIVVLDPATRVGWAILTNAQDVDFNGINGVLAETLSMIYNIRVKTDLPHYTGLYELPGGYGALTISMKGDSLYSDYLQEAAMVPDGDRRWKVTGSNGYSIGYEFIADPAGRITAVRMGQFVWYKKATP